MDILRFLTAGSVDDGKSTLIGRLLYDSKNILIDQMEALERSSKNREDGSVDLALLTDGLRAEREQGITIDVAYKYFSTPKRKFIIADAPGHIQYTRNMVTGASNSDLIIILIDARNGVIEQTKRHSIIASLLNIPYVVVAINKMDLVDYSEHRYNEIVAQYQEVAKSLNLKNVTFIPISALNGDNIVDVSENIKWYTGNTLLNLLETTELQSSTNLTNGRFPVQLVLRPQTDDLHDYRGYAGQIESGIFKKGDTIVVYPSGVSATISAIEVNNKLVQEAFAPQSAVLHLEEDVDISRGDLIVKPDNLLKINQEIEALVCWMDDKPMNLRNRYLLQHNTKVVPAMIKGIDYKLDVNTLEKQTDITQARLNEVVKVQLKTASPLAYDSYQQIRTNGGAILIDETSFVTVGAVLFI
ncbi:sulfate adenylyltransferase subunit 1 [Capnocytophaga catalasegens]|uniref:sulfate adenylyltransferase n=1 Tax=Capnocytophaga catalasegens TaxID=1004260 RepID=A0AAV5AYW5_9FLAO|nr:GTP-binding protein [Capnocytophaga catalasegens]GIZ14560.1 sulfate adenylyltransferase subunit 1 [Capnocytophaga catalasegens]GJM50762.1 sulfate adenylyltransferase subunit 1 [Capnocytophaga catalasegens]GJM51915.1 sulfate adenylyltransferase subunit 1 [Capnocytophaga catalasegens]